MTHPCDGHVCDNCAICQAGICCGSITPTERVQLEAAGNNPGDERLREAVGQEHRAQPSIAELVRREASSQSQATPPANSPLALPAPAPVSVPDESRKETVYVVPSRTPR